jgi:predicted GIY-YIG superfamily endonuclease
MSGLVIYRRVELRMINYYCLAGSDGTYYVGKAFNLPRRLMEHRIGRGSQHTKKWANFACIGQIEFPYVSEEESRRMERWYAATMRRKLGVDEVYCS